MKNVWDSGSISGGWNIKHIGTVLRNLLYSPNCSKFSIQFKEKKKLPTDQDEYF